MFPSILTLDMLKLWLTQDLWSFLYVIGTNREKCDSFFQDLLTRIHIAEITHFSPKCVIWRQEHTYHPKRCDPTWKTGHYLWFLGFRVFLRSVSGFCRELFVGLFALCLIPLRPWSTMIYSIKWNWGPAMDSRMLPRLWEEFSWMSGLSFCSAFNHIS